MSFIEENGTYSLTNAQGGTCMDLSGGDNRSIIGYGYHGGSNQQWIFHRAGDPQTYYIMSLGSRQFLAPDGEPRNGCKLIAQGEPYAWCAKDELGVEDSVRLLPLNDSNYYVDLQEGKSTPGTPIQLWERSGENQVWKLKKTQ